IPAQDGSINARDLLIDDSASADIEVPNFGITHKSVRQPHALARSVNEGPRILSQEQGIVGCARERDGVRLPLRAISPAIEDDEDYRFGCRHCLCGVLAEQSTTPIPSSRGPKVYPVCSRCVRW